MTRDSQASAEKVGLTDDQTGEIASRPFTQQDAWVPPQVTIIDRDLAYSWFNEREKRVRPATDAPVPSLWPSNEAAVSQEFVTQDMGYRVDKFFGARARDPRGMVDRFVRIKTDPQVLAFVRRFGQLELCWQHGEPWTHLGVDKQCPVRQDSVWIYEPLDRWQHYVALMNALLAIAIAVRDGKPGNVPNWETIIRSRPADERHHFQPAERIVENVSTAQYYLLDELENLIRLGDVHPAPEWLPGDTVDIRHKGSPAGLMALQILVAVGGAHAYAICNHCGIGFKQAKKGKPGQRAWCHDCGQKASSRQGQRDYRARQRTKEQTDEPARA